MRAKIVALVVLFALALSARAEFSAASITRTGRVTMATVRWSGERADLPPAAIVEEVLEGPWNLSESALPDDATLVSHIAGSTRATLRALTVIEKPGQVITRKLALPLGTHYRMRILLPFVSGCDTRYDFHLPEGVRGGAREFSVRLADGLSLCETKMFGQRGAPTGIRYAPAALADGQLIRFVTRATDEQGCTFTDEDWFLVYQRGGQARGFSLPLLAGAGEGRDSEAVPENGVRDLFLRQLREATTLTFALHGSPNAVAPTLSLSDPQKVTAAEMALQSERRGWRPPLQLVFADSCSTLAEGARAIPTALGIQDSTPGRAYVGFDAPAVVDGHCARLFWETLRAGKTVREAVAEAQRYYDAHNVLDGKTYPAILRIVGDPEARLNRLKATNSNAAGWWELVTASSEPAR
ncbi:MAG: hypothetical protein QM758_01250 [Armatimonas sp.]